MRVLGYILLAVVCLLLAVGTFVFVAAPVDLVRDQIVAAVKRETGRDLIIRGDTSFAVYPDLGVAMEGVELSAPPDMDGAPFLKMASLKLAMPLSALLERRVVVKEFVLDRPEIDLRVDENGQESWAFSAPRATSGTAPAEEDFSPELQEFIDNSNGNQSQAARSDSDAGTGTGLSGVELGDVRIIAGTLRYSDARSGKQETLTDANLSIGLAALSAPLSLSGNAIWNGRRVPVEATVTSVEDLLAKRPVKVALSIAPQNLDLQFNGNFDPDGEGRLSGQLKLNSGDVGGVAGWLTGARDAAGPVRTVALEGAVSARKDRVALRQARFTVNDLKGQGQIGLSFGGRKRVDGSVQLDHVRTVSFLGGHEGRAAFQGQATGGSAAGGQPSQGGGSRAGADDWSSTAINFKPLRSLDADVAVAFQSLTHGDMQFGAGKMKIALKGGRLQLDANPVAIYEGAARAAIVVDARPTVATYGARIVTQGISALPLMKALADFDWLSGSTTAQIDIKGRGLSQRQMIRTMDGTASLSFADGAIEGLNIAKIMRGVRRGQFNNFDRVPGEKTDFSSLSASFRIAQGVASNSDLALLGPLVRASGSGQASLGARTLNYRLIPKLVASLEGQGGVDETGIAIPLKITGPWAKPSVLPDLDSVLRDPQAAAAATKQLETVVEKARKKIKSGKVRDLLDGVLGGGQSGDGAQQPLGGLLGDLLQQ